MKRLVIALAALVLLRADMYQDAGNAKLPEARTNLGIGGGISAAAYAADGTGGTDASAALAAACAAAQAAGKPLALAGNYKISANLALNCDLQDMGGSRLLPDAGITVTQTGNVTAADTAWLFGGAGVTMLATAPWVSVQWWGAGHGIADDATAFRAAIGNNRTVFVPPANYVFHSSELPLCCAFVNAGVRVTGKSNFIIDAYGAKVAMDDANKEYNQFLIDNSTNWTLRGLECVATNRAGISPAVPTACFALHSVVKFHIHDIYLSGNWGGAGEFSYGDWLVDGVIERMRGDKMGSCFDYAYLKNITIRDVVAKGADNNGNTGPGQIGVKCFSNVWDVPNESNNHTGIAYTNTDGVLLTGFDASNFGSGYVIWSGQNFTLVGNHWHDNVQTGGFGRGGVIGYSASGPFSSVGRPPKNIVISGDRYTNNGGGSIYSGGVVVEDTAITNSDLIANVQIDGQFIGNNPAGINGLNGVHLSNVRASAATGYTATAATLPVCNAAAKHLTVAVSDQSGAPTYRGALTGGGAIAVLAYCNGTSWEAH